MKNNIYKTIKRCNHLVALKFKDMGVFLFLMLINVTLSVILPLLTMEFINALIQTTSINRFIKIMMFYFLSKIIEIFMTGLVDFFFYF